VARTLKGIAANPDDFYHGAMAHELAAAMQKGGVDHGERPGAVRG